MNNTDKKDKPDLLTQMSSAVSHEIRNPLAIISNSLYFIKTKLTAGGAALDPKVAKHLEQQGGTAKAENAPGRGTRVTLSLPLSKGVRGLC